MRVFAIILLKKKVSLKIFKSVKEFEKTESWIDHKFLNVVTTKDLKKWYSKPLDNESVKLGYIKVLKSGKQIIAHTLLHEEFLKL